MKKFLATTFVLILLAASESISYGQSVAKWTYSAMNSTTANDTVYVAAGQIMSGESLTPKVLHGYYPLQYSLVGIDEEELGMSIYPNPFHSELTIEISNSGSRPIDIEVRDLQSKLVLKDSFNGSTYQMSSDLMSRGVYIISIRKESQTIVRKIIKQ